MLEKKPDYKLSFDEGPHHPRSCLYPYRQCKKDKSNKFITVFKILCNVHDCFIRHIAVYQTKKGPMWVFTQM